MSTAIRAIYKHGVLELLDAAEGLTDNQVIELEIRPLPPVTSDPRIMGGSPALRAPGCRLIG